jgi:DNA-directed RNA polymerase subunit K/omega
MSDLDEVSFDNHSDISGADPLSGGSNGDDYDDFDDDDIEDQDEEPKMTEKKVTEMMKGIEIEKDTNIELEDDDDEEDEEEEDESYLKKFDKELRKNYLVDFHPEAVSYNNIEIQTLSQVIRDPVTGIIIDDFHKTMPFLTKYEKTRILGVRAKQIDSGAKPFIDAAKNNLIDGYVIAQKELEYKRLPFIIRRPLPNGGSEFWKISDLQIIN